MGDDTRKRQPSGTPAGGQYAAARHPEPDAALDLPSVSTKVGDDNNFAWLLPNNRLHRLEGPAVQRNGGPAAGGEEAWYLEGEKHRIGGPAVQWNGGTTTQGGEEWYLEGRRHRIGGPAEQWKGGITAGGGEAWWAEDRRHRIGGPAEQWEGGVAAGGGERWYSEGHLHRLDGPAVQYGGGITATGGDEQYWIDDVRVPAEQYEFLVACRSDTRRMATPTERPSDGPQAPDGPVRPGV